MQFITFLALEDWIWFPFWAGIGVLFIFERVFSVRHSGWRAMLLAGTLIPELLYEFVLQAVFVNSMIDITFNRKANWGHVDHEKVARRHGQIRRRLSSAEHGSVIEWTIGLLLKHCKPHGLAFWPRLLQSTRWSMQLFHLSRYCQGFIQLSGWVPGTHAQKRAAFTLISLIRI